jgi:hypothetical protein
MNHRQKFPQCRARNYRQAFEKLDRALKKNTSSNNNAKINLTRLALFGVADEPEQSSGPKIP